MRNIALLLAFILMSSSAPVLAFGLDSVGLGVGGYVVDHNKKMKRQHPVGTSSASGAIRGAQIGTFVGLPFVGAGIGAAVGGIGKMLHRRRQ